MGVLWSLVGVLWRLVGVPSSLVELFCRLVGVPSKVDVEIAPWVEEELAAHRT